MTGNANSARGRSATCCVLQLGEEYPEALEIYKYDWICSVRFQLSHSPARIILGEILSIPTKFCGPETRQTLLLASIP